MKIRLPAKIIIQEHSFIARIAARKLKQSKMAVTIGHKILLHNVSKKEFLQNESWVCHELKHVKQFQEHGFLTFVFRYLAESIRKGYYNNKFEIEAREAESDRKLLNEFGIN